MVSNCQVCGNPMFSYKDMGLNKDGSINRDFCENCYRFGAFTADRSQEEFSAINAFVPMTAYGVGMTGNGMIGVGMPLAPVPVGLELEVGEDGEFED